MSDDIIAKAERLLSNITPGPWETHVFYVQAGVRENGECCYCGQEDTLLVQTATSEDGSVWHLHRTPSRYPDEIKLADPNDEDGYDELNTSWRTIYNTAGDKIIGGYDWEAGGVVQSKADAEFIAAAPELVRQLLELVKQNQATNQSGKL